MPSQTHALHVPTSFHSLILNTTDAWSVQVKATSVKTLTYAWVKGQYLPQLKGWSWTRSDGLDLYTSNKLYTWQIIILRVNFFSPSSLPVHFPISRASFLRFKLELQGNLSWNRCLSFVFLQNLPLYLNIGLLVYVISWGNKVLVHDADHFVVGDTLYFIEVNLFVHSKMKLITISYYFYVILNFIISFLLAPKCSFSFRQCSLLFHQSSSSGNLSPLPSEWS